MKRIKIYNWLIMLMVMLAFSSCEEKLSSEFTPYEPLPASKESVDLVYLPVADFPQLKVLESDTPTFQIEGVYKFILGEVTSEEGAFNANQFSIDKLTGVVKYDNTGGSIQPGMYEIDVSVSNVSGIAQFKKALSLEVFEVPITVTTDVAEKTMGALEEGEVATLSYTDNSEGGLITDVSYALEPAVSGFTIDAETGVITKTSQAATSTTHVLSFAITTNLGSLAIADLVTVIVGDPPVIQYVQQDGSTPLAQVTVSPWTAYTTATPALTGMEASGGWTLLLPDELDPAALSAAADGSISIAADQGIAEGSYLISVQATNAAGIFFDFPDVFTIVVEQRWSEFVNEDFNDGKISDEANPINSIYPMYNTFPVGGSTQEWSKVVVTKTGLPTIEGFRKFNPGAEDGCLTREVDFSGYKALRVSFGEQFGYNTAFVETYLRSFYFGEDVTSLATGTFNDADWNTLMEPSDSRWESEPTWKTRLPAFVSNVEIDLTGVSGNTIYLNWRLFPNDPAVTQNGQYILDSVIISGAEIFAAEEE